MKNFVIGAQLYSVRTLVQDAEGLKNTLKSLKEMGYNTCQLSGQSRDIPDEVVRDILEETGMTPVVTHNSMDDFDKELDALIRRHKTWNVKYAGLGSMSGAIVAAILLGLVEIFLTYWIGSLATPIVLFGIMLLFLVIRPEGISGKFAKEKV